VRSERHNGASEDKDGSEKWFLQPATAGHAYFFPLRFLVTHTTEEETLALFLIEVNTAAEPYPT
jgi:hypothetical protein